MNIPSVSLPTMASFQQKAGLLPSRNVQSTQVSALSQSEEPRFSGIFPKKAKNNETQDYFLAINRFWQETLNGAVKVTGKTKPRETGSVFRPGSITEAKVQIGSKTYDAIVEKVKVAGENLLQRLELFYVEKNDLRGPTKLLYEVKPLELRRGIDLYYPKSIEYTDEQGKSFPPQKFSSDEQSQNDVKNRQIEENLIFKLVKLIDNVDDYYLSKLNYYGEA